MSAFVALTGTTVSAQQPNGSPPPSPALSQLHAVANGVLSNLETSELASPSSYNLKLRPAAGTSNRSPDGLGDPGITGRAAVGLPLSGLSLNSLSPGATVRPGADTTRPADSPLTSTNGNIFYGASPGSSFMPYLGLGQGGPGSTAGFGAARATGTTNGADSVRSYQGVAGFALTLDKTTKLDFGYRISNTQRPNMPLSDTSDISSAERDRAAMISLHYDLGLMK